MVVVQYMVLEVLVVMVTAKDMNLVVDLVRGELVLVALEEVEVMSIAKAKDEFWLVEDQHILVDLDVMVELVKDLGSMLMDILVEMVVALVVVVVEPMLVVEEVHMEVVLGVEKVVVTEDTPMII